MPRRSHLNPDRILCTIAHAQIRLRRTKPDRTYDGRIPLPDSGLWPWTCCHYDLGYSIAVVDWNEWRPGRNPIPHMHVLPRATVLRLGYSWSRDGLILCRLPEDPQTLIEPGDIERPWQIQQSVYPHTPDLTAPSK